MRRLSVLALLAFLALTSGPSAFAGPYDSAPDFILNVQLSGMTNPPSYNLYAQWEHLNLEPIDIWYRVSFHVSGELDTAVAVYSTRADSALIRSVYDRRLFQNFHPGTDSSLAQVGYLLKIGIRTWTTGCDYESVPANQRDSEMAFDELPELLWSDSIDVPAYVERPGFVASTKVEYYVNEFGDVCAAGILESSGSAFFDLFALDVAETWHFHPAMREGKPIGLWMNWVVSNEAATGEGFDSVKR